MHISKLDSQTIFSIHPINAIPHYRFKFKYNHSIQHNNYSDSTIVSIMALKKHLLNRNFIC